ncbi:MAG TPA: hypothetical protein VII81_02980, partial [Terriglobales bacterium]
LRRATRLFTFRNNPDVGVPHIAMFDVWEFASSVYERSGINPRSLALIRGCFCFLSTSTQPPIAN